MSNYQVELDRQARRPDQGGDQVAAQAAGPGAVAPTADAGRPRDRHRAVDARDPRRHAGFLLAEPQGWLRRPDRHRRPRHDQAPEQHAADRGGLPGLLPRGARLRHPVRPGPAAVPARRGHHRQRSGAQRRARSTSAARISAASPIRASRTSGSSARVTARATTGSGSRRTAPRSARRRAAWTGSRSRSIRPAS